MSQKAKIFTVIAVLVAIIGIFGYRSYSKKQKELHQLDGTWVFVEDGTTLDETNQFKINGNEIKDKYGKTSGKINYKEKKITFDGNGEYYYMVVTYPSSKGKEKSQLNLWYDKRHTGGLGIYVKKGSENYKHTSR